MLRAFIAVLWTVFLLSSPLAAQEPEKIDYSKWEQFATQAEDRVEDTNATSAQMAQIRERVVEWRNTFQAGQNVNGDRISALRQQIEALGPIPAEGEAEADDIAARRAELDKQMATLQAPRLTAVEALSRANAIIGSIDAVESRRKAAEMTQASPSPLLPTSLKEASETGITVAHGVWTDMSPTSRAGQNWSDLRPRLPRVAIYLIAAMLLLSYGRSWVQSMPSRLSARASEYSRAVVMFITSLGQIAVPMIGVFLLIRAIQESGLPGGWTKPILDSIPIAAVVLFGGNWLTRTLFPRQLDADDTLHMNERNRAKARRMGNSLSVIFSIHHIVATAILPGAGIYSRAGDTVDRVPAEISEAAAGVWHFVLIVLAALALFRLGTALRGLTKDNNTSELQYRHHILAWAGLLTRVAAVAAVGLAAAGYINLGNLLTWPWILSLALIGLLVVLQDFIADVFNMIKRGEEGAREGLGPLLIGFVLILLSVPLFMVIWGARETDLAEYWTQFQNGASLGGIRLSPGSVLTFLFVFAIGYSISRAIQGAMKTSILPKTKLDPGGQNAVVAGIGYVGVVVAALLAVTAAGIDLSSLAIVAGALSLGIGFGMQTIVSNFVSGIILLIERPISVGDWISAGGQQGIVKRISVRSTQVETFDKTEVIVPNSDLITQPVVNWTRHNKIGRIIIPIGVAYGTDTRKVDRILREIIEDQAIVTIDPPPAVLFRGFGADSMDFEIRAILSDVSAGMGVTSEVCHQIAERFAAEGIEIPFAQRDIWLRNPDALRPELELIEKDHQPEPAPAKQPEKGAPKDAEDFKRRYDPKVTFDDDGDADGAGDADGGDGDSR